MPLTNIEIARASTDAKSKKMPDGNGLYVYLTQTTKSFRTDYVYASKRYTVVHGKHPKMTLSQARQAHGETKALLAQGINPATHKRLDKLARSTAFGDSFKATADHWYNGKRDFRSTAWREAHSL